MTEPILVIGATGLLGQPVVRHLLRAGLPVRVLARTPEKARRLFGGAADIQAGDVDDEAAVAAALSGCGGVHISLKGGPRAADFDRIEYRAVARIAQAARQAGIPHLTLISAYAVGAAQADTPESRAKYMGELAVQASGVPYTIFRASWFMETLPLFVQGRQLSLIGRQIHPLHWVAADDYARMVARSYTTPAALNKTLHIYGPEAYTMREAMELYARQAGLQVAPISTTALGLLGTLTFNQEWKSMAVLMQHYEKWGEDGSPAEANQLLGAPDTTLSAWCAAQIRRVSSLA